MRGGRSSQTPVSPSSRVPSTPSGGERADQRLLEVADVLLHVAAVPLQVEDRVADELARAVKGRLPAAVGLDHLDLRVPRARAARRSRRCAGRASRRAGARAGRSCRGSRPARPRPRGSAAAPTPRGTAPRRAGGDSRRSPRRQASFRGMAVVLVEGITDRIALEAVAAKLGVDLAGDGIEIVPIGGAQAIRRAAATVRGRARGRPLRRRRGAVVPARARRCDVRLRRGPRGRADPRARRGPRARRSSRHRASSRRSATSRTSSSGAGSPSRRSCGAGSRTAAATTATRRLLVAALEAGRDPAAARRRPRARPAF